MVLLLGIGCGNAVTTESSSKESKRCNFVVVFNPSEDNPFKKRMAMD